MAAPPDEAPLAITQTVRNPGRSTNKNLKPSEYFWADHQKWLEERGYMLRSRYKEDWVPSWNGEKPPRPCEDGKANPHPNVMDATRISDGRIVALKRIVKSEHPKEAEVSEFLSSDHWQPTAESHCVPVIEILELQDDQDVLLLITPFLRPYDDPQFETIGEVVEFFSQIIKGLNFMHSHDVSHGDCTRRNIMMDATTLYPNGFHSVDIWMNRDYKGWAKRYTRTERPPQYCWIGFAHSRRYLPDEGLNSTRVLRTDPKHNNPRRVDPDSEPFYNDVYSLAQMIKTEFVDVYYGFGFMSALLKDMMHEDIWKRPRMYRVTTQFGSIYRALSASRLRSRIIPHDEHTISRWGHNLTHSFRHVRFTLQGLPPVPRPYASARFKRTQYFLREASTEIFRGMDILSPEEGRRLLEENRKLKEHGEYGIGRKKPEFGAAIPDDRAYEERAKAHYFEVEEFCYQARIREITDFFAKKLESAPPPQSGGDGPGGLPNTGLQKVSVIPGAPTSLDTSSPGE